MGFDHMALVRQNLPHITKGGPVTRLDTDVLLVIAEKLPMSTTTYEWFMTMEDMKHALNMKPETWDQGVNRSINKMVDQSWLKVRNGTGKKANTYTLTDKLMAGAATPPERKIAAASGDVHECRCKGKDHTNDAACRQYEYAQRKAGKSKKSRRGKGGGARQPRNGDTNAPCKYGPTHQYTEARKPLTQDQIDGGVTSILWCDRDKRCKARMGIHADGKLYGDK